MSTLAEALAPKSDQLNADDLIPGPRVLKITKARISKEERQTKIILNFEGDQGKPWKPCKTMGRAMVMVWAITDEQQLIGKSVQVYRDPQVKFGDQGEVGGIRISHMSGIDKPASVKLTVSQGKKAIFTFAPLAAETFQANDAAGKWAAAYIAKLPNFLTIEEVEAFAAEKAARLAELQDKRPELHKQVTTALTACRKSFDDTDPFTDQPSVATDASPGTATAAVSPTDAEQDEAASNEDSLPARADADHGDGFDGTDAEADIIAHIGRKVRISDVNGIINSRIGELDEDGQDRVRSVAMDRIAEIRAAEKVDG